VYPVAINYYGIGCTILKGVVIKTAEIGSIITSNAESLAVTKSTMINIDVGIINVEPYLRTDDVEITWRD
jgi:hypothetical protein